MALFAEIPSVQGASKYEQKVSEAPSAVSIVTAADIKRLGYRTLGDLLRGVTSFYVTHDRNYTYVGVRGFGRPGDYNSRILVLVNGHRINDMIYDAALIGTEGFLDLSAVERVEIIRGPSSVLYGTNAVFAVVNVITKRGRDLQGFEVSGEWSSHDTYRLTLGHGRRFPSGLETFLLFSAQDSRGEDLYFKEFDAAETNFGQAVGLDGDRYYRVFGTASYRGLTLQGGYSWRRKLIPTGSFSTVFGIPGNETLDTRGFAELRAERTMLGERLTLLGRAFYDDGRYRGTYLYARPPEAAERDLLQNRDTSDGQSWGAELRGNLRVAHWLSLLAGGELLHAFTQDQANFDQTRTYLDDRRSSVNGGLFLQASLGPWKGLLLNAGLRYDHYGVFGGTANPRLALIYNPLPTTTVKLMFGSAFRAPSALEVYYHDGLQTAKPSQGLVPETVRGYELFVEQGLFPGVRASVSAYYNAIRKLIDFWTDPGDGLLVYRNLEEVRAVGVELALEARLRSGVEGVASYAFQDARAESSDALLTNSPRHLAKARIMFPIFPERLLVGAELLYVGARKTLAGSEAEAHILANLTLLSRGWVKGLEASGSIYNFFNKTYGDPGSAEHAQDVIQQPGRVFRLNVTYAF